MLKKTEVQARPPLTSLSPSNSLYKEVSKDGEDCKLFPDSKVHGAYLGPSWGRQDSKPCYQGYHVGQMEYSLQTY